MASPQPLSALKQLPLTPSSSPLAKVQFKRSASSQMGENTPVQVQPWTFKKPRLATFDNVHGTGHEVKTPLPKSKSTSMLPPAVAGALTPSTSTVACSSSPPRITSSSPSRRPAVKSSKVVKKVSKKSSLDGPSQKVVVSQSKPFIFGRHRHRPTESPDGSPSTVSVSGTTTTTPRLAVPKHLHHLVNSLDVPATTVFLPRQASHTSRVHAFVEYLPSSDSARLLVIGQNGLKLDGKRVLSGQTVEVLRGEHVVNFYGAKVELAFLPKVEMGAVEEEEEIEEVEEEEARERLFTPGLSSPPLSPLSPVHSLSDNAQSLPPSSPPVAPLEMDIDFSIYTDGNRESSPLSPDDEMDGLKEREIKAELIDNGNQAPPLAPEGVDLPALLASTVVFSGSSKLSLPDLVKHMLDSQPSLKSHGDEAAWNRWCAPVLEDTPMFGKVERHGKDASGRPLLPHYFYNPSNDPDTSRSKELGGLVRPLRTVQRAGGKAIDWRPVGSGRRRY